MAPFLPPGASPQPYSGPPPIGPGATALHFTLNGKPTSVQNPNPHCSLADYIRKEVGLTGTKISCNQGGCGACTVVLAALPREGLPAWRKPVDSCLQPLCSVGGLEVTTIEGLKDGKKGMHPLQKAIVEKDGTQCGFCTAGMVGTSDHMDFLVF